MARPWWQLKPAGNDDSISCLTFPALVDGRYVVVSTERNGVLLCEETSDSDNTVVIVVEKTGKVSLKVGAEATFDVHVNDRAVEKGAATSVLKMDDRIKLGDRSYALKRLSPPIGELRASMRQVIQCSICLRSCQDPQLLRCGHSFCSPCLTQMIDLAMRAAPNDNHRFEPGLLAIMDEHEMLQQTRTIKCGVCRRMFSCWEASKAYRPIALIEAMEVMQKWVDFDDTRSKCAACQDSRCLVDLREYEYCEDCRMILCPVCALEGHREHRLRERKVIVATMHEQGKRLASMKMALDRLRRLKRGVIEKMDECQNEFMRQTGRMMPPVSNAVGQCRNTLTQAETRLQPFATIDQQLMANFDDGVKEGQATIEKTTSIVERIEKVLQEVRTMLPPEEAPVE